MNVRLDAERLRKVRALRGRGIRVSDVVRQAIDEHYLKLQPERKPDTKAIIRRLFEQYPDPPGLASRRYDVHQRAAAREAIVRKLRSGK
jgi:hypothetical protein